MFHCFSRELHPCSEGNLKVHNCEEWVDAIFFLNDTVEDILIGKFFILVLNAESNQIDSILSFKLEDLHLLIDLHITVLSSHTSI